MLRERIEHVRERIRQACERCARQSSSVTLVGVTKGIPPEIIAEAITHGLTEIGENRVQEARAKQLALGSRLKALGSSLQPTASSLQPMVRWHLIGHLQRNKAKDAVELFDVIQSVDSLKLIDELERQADQRASSFKLQAAGNDLKPIEVFVQVNISGEETKFGCSPSETQELFGALMQRPHLRFRGLMTIAPFSESPEMARPHFRSLRALRDEVVAACSLQPARPGSYEGRAGAALSLSMGMSHDFEVAIEEGADIVRIGTAIFGERK